MTEQESFMLTPEEDERLMQRLNSSTPTPVQRLTLTIMHLSDLENHLFWTCDDCRSRLSNPTIKQPGDGCQYHRMAILHLQAARRELEAIDGLVIQD